MSSIWNGKYTSIHPIIEKVYRDMNMTEDINIANAVEWAGEAVEHIGMPGQLIEKVDFIIIENFRGQLPCDLHLITTCRGALVNNKNCADNSNCPDCSEECLCSKRGLNYIPMRVSTDAYHITDCGDCEGCSLGRGCLNPCSEDMTYRINNDYMFTNFSKGVVQVSYKAIPTDNMGFPLIPDQITFKEAVSGHIKWKLGFIKLMSGKINQAAYQILERDRDWYIGAAQNRSKMPSYDMMESLKNQWIRLIPKINHHSTGFRSVGEREQRYTHNSYFLGGTNGKYTNKDTNRTFFFVVDSCGNVSEVEGNDCNC